MQTVETDRETTIVSYRKLTTRQTEEAGKMSRNCSISKALINMPPLNF